MNKIAPPEFKIPFARHTTGSGSICGGYTAGGVEAIVGCSGFGVGSANTVGLPCKSPK